MVYENLILVFTFILIGSLLKRSPWFPENSGIVLSSFVLNVSLPAIIILSVSNLTLSMEAVQPVVLHWIIFPINILLIYIFSKALKLSRSVMGALIIVSTLGNTAFLGLPMTESLFGREGLPFAILYDQLGSAFGFLFFGAVLVPIFTGKKVTSLTDILKRLVTFPPFLALVIGLLIKFFPLHAHMTNVLIKLAATLIPCAMISVGFQMKYKISFSELKPLVLGLGIKLIALPLILFVITKMLGWDGLGSKVAILQASMPPMITAGAMAMENGLEEKLSASLVGYGLIISFLTIPVIHWLIQ